MLDRQHPESTARTVLTTVPGNERVAERELAFRRLADQHLERSYRLVAVVLGSGSDAQDAVHDAFVTA